MSALLPLKTHPLMPAEPDKDQKHRLARYIAWAGPDWYKPDLAAYRDHLLNDYKPSSVSSHLATVRGRYKAVLRERDLFYELAARVTDSPLEAKAFVDELVERIKNAIDPAAAPVKDKVIQDVTDTKHLRLTAAQASALMSAPGVDTLGGLRDTAIIALLLCTGIREGELCALDVADLRQRFGGDLALHVREGKGRKERLIPYGELEWVLVVIDKWLKEAGIEGGPVFRGVYKGGRTLRPSRLSARAVQYLITGYPVVVDGQLTVVRPHDLRRTYARRLYRAGVDLVAIQQNLGHASQDTTLTYIGTLGVQARRPPDIYAFDLAALTER